MTFIIINLFLMLSLYIGHVALHPERRPIDKTPKDIGLEYENISFKSDTDGVVLKGWWIQAEEETEKVIIFSHAYGFNRENMPFSTLELAKYFHNQGYNILMYDFRNSGESGGSETTIGQNEKGDVLAAVHYAVDTKKTEDVALFGWSMGASSSILAAPESKYVKAVIADSPFASLEEYAEDSFNHWTDLPKFFGKWVTKIVEVFNKDINPKEVKPIVAAEKMEEKPLFLIHAKDDPSISYEESKKIKNASKEATLWTPEKGKHIKAIKYNKEEYIEKVTVFLNKWL